MTAFRIAAIIFCGIAIADEVPSGVHYAPEENLEAIDVGLIDSAAKCIDMAAFSLTDPAIIEALINARIRGVALRLLLDPGQHQALDRLVPLLPFVGVKHKGAYMHLKSYVVDGSTLRAGAANFSLSGLKRQNNDLIILHRASAIAAFEMAFTDQWRAAAKAVGASEAGCGG